MVSSTEGTGRLFRIHRPGATSVRLSGCFTGWDEGAIDLRDAGGGWWETEQHLEPGDYEFQYVIDHSWRLADYASNGVKLNGYGQWVSLLIVSEARVETQAAEIVVGRVGTRTAQAA